MKLIKAIRTNNLDEVKSILPTRFLGEINACDYGSKRTNPLCVASQMGFSKIVEELLAFGADPDFLNPLGVAFKKRHPDVIKILLNAGAKPSSRHLFRACGYSYTEIVRMIVSSSGINLNKRNERNQTLLKVVVLRNNIQIAKVLLSAGADPNKSYVLHTVCKFRDAEFAEELLVAGADPNKPNILNNVPLHTAVLAQKTRIVKVLIKAGATLDGNISNGNECNPLNMAVKYGYTEIVKILIEAGASVSFIENESLGYVVGNKHIEIMRLLTNQGVNIDVVGIHSNTLLYAACYNDDIDMVILLLTSGANPLDSKSGGFPLIAASKNDNLEIMSMLLDAADWTKCDTSTEYQLSSSLNNASNNRNVDMIELLLGVGANPDILANKISRPRYTRLTKLLLRFGSNLTSSDIEKTYMPSLSTLSLTSMKKNQITPVRIPRMLLLPD